MGLCNQDSQPSEKEERFGSTLHICGLANPSLFDKRLGGYE